MVRQLLASFACVMVAATCVAGPAVAAPAASDASADPGAVEIPKVRDLKLSEAVEQIRAATAPIEPKFKYADLHDSQNVYNLTNWVVCYTWPDAISPKSRT